jgi:lambda family phage portal protein
VREVKRPGAPRPPLLDRALLHVAPALAASRARARREYAMESARAVSVSAAASAWQAARQERAALRGYVPIRGLSADAETLPNLDLQRSRSREQHANAPIARGAIQTVAANVVGTGLQLTAQVDRDAVAGVGVSDEQADALERALEREWDLFTTGHTADAHRRLTWPQIEELAFISHLVNGDVFAAFVAAPDRGAFDLAVQLIEADAVSNPQRAANSETLSDGIEYGPGGVPARIHVAEIPRAHGNVRRWVPMPVRAADGTPRVLHLMRPDRIGQSRGVPYLAPVLGALKELETYTEAELRAAVLNACIAIMGQTEDGSSPLATEAAGGHQGSDPAGLRRADIEFEPGMVLEGFLPGESLKSFGSDRPATGFDPFVQAILRQIGVGLELPFEVLIKHFTASYSAARAALLEAWKFYRGRRAWLADALHRPVYAAVIENAVLRGRLVLPGFREDPLLRLAWLGSAWTGPSPGQINPEVEVKAAVERINATLSTHAREAAELTGEHWESTARQLAKERQIRAQLGLPDQPRAGAPAPVPPRPSVDTPQPQDAPEAPE